jgi:hypothetical protein
MKIETLGHCGQESRTRREEKRPRFHAATAQCRRSLQVRLLFGDVLLCHGSAQFGRAHVGYLNFWVYSDKEIVVHSDIDLYYLQTDPDI